MRKCKRVPEERKKKKEKEKEKERERERERKRMTSKTASNDPIRHEETWNISCVE